MFRAISILTVLLFSCLAAAAQPSIDWRVQHPFRFFTNNADFEMQREALADVLAAEGGTVPATIVSDLERLLNDPRWLREWYKTDGTLYANPRTSGRPERGWAHHINRRKAFCWDANLQWHSSCVVDRFGEGRRTDYVMPQGHTVVLKLEEPPQGECIWKADRDALIRNASLVPERTTDCTAQIEARIPFEPDRPEAEQGVAITVTLPDATEVTAPRIVVKDRLVVGIGDSFSSGEGNPDSPVEIDRQSQRANLNKAFVYDEVTQRIKYKKSHSLPVRGPNGPANWLDRKCHRSAYSYHLRTALQIALADPKHSAVTFLGYACSGAEVAEGLLLPFKGAEGIDPGQLTGDGPRRRDMSEIDRLTIELCRDAITRANPVPLSLNQPISQNGKTYTSVPLRRCPQGRFLRPIDLLLVSIGGNDVGFTPLIVDVLTKTRPPLAGFATQFNVVGQSLLTRMASIVKAQNVVEAERRVQALPARFSALRKALALLPIRSSNGQPNVIMTAFPKIELNQNGRVCGEQNPRERMDGFNVGGMLFIDVPTLRLVSDFANKKLYPALKSAAAAGNWHFVDSHREAFAKHGVCAQKRTASSVSALENMMLPYVDRVNQQFRWFDFEPFSPYRDLDFSAVRDTRPYAPRQRWVRTLNDICLFVQYRASGTPPPPSQWGVLDLIEACLGGPFHPTAEGHAHIADAAYAEAARILALPPPDVASLRPD
ncbi:MAG: hypothetical protein M9924_17590 [Rhizobiaceae bacterium]|nr:hypothetical protein [Rhizobiaceae bacterium]